MNSRILYTIGCTQCTAKAFFDTLHRNGVTELVDVRCWRNTQHAGFALEKNLEYFCTRLAQCEYRVDSRLLPFAHQLRNYKEGRIAWGDYARDYWKKISWEWPYCSALLEPDNAFESSCLMCACADHGNCHRSIAAEFIAQRINKRLRVVHLHPMENQS